jgi:hypothetical protein
MPGKKSQQDRKDKRDGASRKIQADTRRGVEGVFVCKKCGGKTSKRIYGKLVCVKCG